MFTRPARKYVTSVVDTRRRRTIEARRITIQDGSGGCLPGPSIVGMGYFPVPGAVDRGQRARSPRDDLAPDYISRCAMTGSRLALLLHRPARRSHVTSPRPDSGGQGDRAGCTVAVTFSSARTDLLRGRVPADSESAFVALHGSIRSVSGYAVVRVPFRGSCGTGGGFVSLPAMTRQRPGAAGWPVATPDGASSCPTWRHGVAGQLQTEVARFLLFSLFSPVRQDSSPPARVPRVMQDWAALAFL